MRRILHVVPSLDQRHGGPLRLVLDLSARAEGRGLTSEVAGPGPLMVADNPMADGRIHAFPARSGAWAYCPALRAWLRENVGRFDGVVVHGAWLYPGWAAAKECRRAGVPYAYYPHGMIEAWAVRGQGFLKERKKRLYWGLAERGVADGASAVFFTTRREQELTRETFALAAPGRLLAPYGIEEGEAARVEPREAGLRQPDGVGVVLYLGRLHPKKNPELLLSAWKKAGPPAGWRLVVAGSGEDGFERLLHEQVDALGLSASVELTGFVAGADKQYLLQRAEWFVLPSSQENFGIAVLEAVRYGCAVAISDGVYLAESFPAGAETMPVDEAAWVAFFRERVADGAHRQRVRDAVRGRLMEEFGMTAVMERWIATLTETFPAR